MKSYVGKVRSKWIIILGLFAYFVLPRFIQIRERTATFVVCHHLLSQVLLTMATDEGDEAFDPSYMGTAEEVVNERVGDNDFVFIKGCTASKAGSVGSPRNHRCLDH